MTASRVVTRHMSGANQLGSRPRAGWATEAHGPLECYRDFRQKYARATSQPFRRAGVFATSTRATGARLKLCQAQAVGRFPAESYSLPIPSFPLQPLRPYNARTRARADATQLERHCGYSFDSDRFSASRRIGATCQVRTPSGVRLLTVSVRDLPDELCPGHLIVPFCDGPRM